VEIPSELLKRRVVHGCLLLGALVLVPELAAAFAPSAARYVPPFLLTSLVAVSFGFALLVWRTRQALQWLFPGCAIEMPVRSRRERMAEIASAWVGVIVSTVLAAGWFWSVL